MPCGPLGGLCDHDLPRIPAQLTQAHGRIVANSATCDDNRPMHGRLRIEATKERQR